MNRSDDVRSLLMLKLIYGVIGELIRVRSIAAVRWRGVRKSPFDRRVMPPSFISV